MQVQNLSISQSREDIIIAKIRRYFASFGKTEVNIQPQNIRMEQPITGQGLNFEFTMGQRQNMRPLETALSQADMFVPVDMAWGVTKVPSPEAPSKAVLDGNVTFYTYPDKAVFDFVNAPNVPEWSALTALWNGRFNVKAATNEIINELSSYNFLRAARLQQYTDADNWPTYQNEQQFVPWFVNPMFRGDQINKINFNAPQGVDTVNATGNPEGDATNVVVLILRGFIIRNATQSISETDAALFMQR